MYEGNAFVKIIQWAGAFSGIFLSSSGRSESVKKMITSRVEQEPNAAWTKSSFCCSHVCKALCLQGQKHLRDGRTVWSVGRTCEKADGNEMLTGTQGCGHTLLPLWYTLHCLKKPDNRQTGQSYWKCSCRPELQFHAKFSRINVSTSDCFFTTAHVFVLEVCYQPSTRTYYQWL